MGWFRFRPYVPVAQRRAKASQEIAKRAKKGETISPVELVGRAIATTFWGRAWCENLESYSDFANRLPRGRTYVRNGSVVNLKIEKGQINALVSGSSLYDIQIDIAAYPKQDWLALKELCAGKIGTLVELLQGRLSKAVMALVTDRDQGLFPKPREIKMRCSCPDYAGLCKHLAAVLYGVGNRLDTSPELLFQLRAVDHLELIEQAIPTAAIGPTTGNPEIRSEDLGEIFGIEIGDEPASKKPRAMRKKTSDSKAAKADPLVKPQSKPKAISKPKPKLLGSKATKTAASKQSAR